jgi:hypothetical protein
MKRRTLAGLLLGIAFCTAEPAHSTSAQGAGEQDDQTAHGKAALLRLPGTAATVAQQDIGNPLWAIPAGQLTATRERPLFAPSRRPPHQVVAPYRPPPPPPAPRATEVEKPSLTLVGTVAGRSSEGIGVFVDPAAKGVLNLRIGEEHNGWALRAVQRRSVTMQKGPDNVVLALPSPELGNGSPPGPEPLPFGLPIARRTPDR